MNKKTHLNIPSDIAPHFAHSLSGILGFEDAIKRLMADLKRFESTIQGRFSSGAEGKERTVRVLIHQSRAMLKLCQSNAGQPYVPYCLAAVSYFLDRDDGIPDFESHDSFDDDEQVFREVVQHFNLRLPQSSQAA